MSAVKKTPARKRPPPKPTTDEQIEILRLNRWAAVLLGNPPDSDLPPKRPMPDFWISDQERSSIARYLRRLAQTPKALKMLEVPKAPPDLGRPVENAERNYYVALDYELTLERLKIEKPGKPVTKLAQGEVGDAWGLGRTVLLEAHADYSKFDHWKWWADCERAKLEHQFAGMIREQQLLEMSKTLRSQQEFSPHNSD